MTDIEQEVSETEAAGMTPATPTSAREWTMQKEGGGAGPFGAKLDSLARSVGGWSAAQMVYAVEVFGGGDDPQVLLTGSEADWMPRAKRWNFSGKPAVKAVIRLSEYRSCLPAKALKALAEKP